MFCGKGVARPFPVRVAHAARALDPCLVAGVADEERTIRIALFIAKLHVVEGSRRNASFHSPFSLGTVSRALCPAGTKIRII